MPWLYGSRFRTCRCYLAKRQNEIRCTKAVLSAGVNWDSFSVFLFGLEEQTMNKDIVEGKWKQVRGEAKSWWGKLTDDDLDRAAGKFDVLTGMLQEKYGYTRERAEEEIDKRVAAYDTSHKMKV
jgi:uncharacterized protein YjbJ (UPF0337 family)